MINKWADKGKFTVIKVGSRVRIRRDEFEDWMEQRLSLIHISVNLCGLPGITVPCGKDSKGLPIGIQMIGDCFMDFKSYDCFVLFHYLVPPSPGTAKEPRLVS